jgi:hypothetical protein
MGRQNRSFLRSYPFTADAVSPAFGRLEFLIRVTSRTAETLDQQSDKYRLTALAVEHHNLNPGSFTAQFGIMEQNSRRNCYRYHRAEIAKESCQGGYDEVFSWVQADARVVHVCCCRAAVVSITRLGAGNHG